MPDDQIHISLDACIPSPKDMGNVTWTSYSIASQLESALDKHGIHQGKLIRLPSIMTLAKGFRSNHLDIHDAFQLLRSSGYDYRLGRMDDPIVFWDPAALPAMMPLQLPQQHAKYRPEET